MSNETMSPADVLAVIDELIAVPAIECEDDVLFAEKAKRMRTAVAALIDREAALIAENEELERLCDATYVAQGADAYHHACETMEAWQRVRAEAGKDPGCEGSLCDGLSWLHSRVDSLEAERDSLAERVKALEERLVLLADAADPITVLEREYEKVLTKTDRGIEVSLNPFPVIRVRFEDMDMLKVQVELTRDFIARAEARNV